jgi:hypothetical protein
MTDDDRYQSTEAEAISDQLRDIEMELGNIHGTMQSADSTLEEIAKAFGSRGHKHQGLVQSVFNMEYSLDKIRSQLTWGAAFIFLGIVAILGTLRHWF